MFKITTVAEPKLVTVISKHQYINNHYYIRFEENNREDTCIREQLYPNGD